MHSQSATTFLQNRSVKTRNGKNEFLRLDDTENEMSDADQWKKNAATKLNPTKNLYSNSSIDYANVQSYDANSSNISLNSELNLVNFQYSGYLTLIYINLLQSINSYKNLPKLLNSEFKKIINVKVQR